MSSKEISNLPEPGLATTWQEIELCFTAATQWENPYLAGEISATFTGPDGRILTRPGFWNGDQNWCVRFAAPIAGAWSWRAENNVGDLGLIGSGEFEIRSPTESDGIYQRRGFWQIPTGGRNLIHADGSYALLAADTAWALPWRATPAQVEKYAAKRSSQGFNGALLMSVQPDMKAVGPTDRTQDEGFGRGFFDLPHGHINELNPEYFQYFDLLSEILLAHEIVPILQPVFFGFGWKGLDVAGPILSPNEYAHYCRYLVARYGARPTIYLIGADGHGGEPAIEAAGVLVEEIDCYSQPTGLHYRPHSLANAYQDRDWLDFQWCQTGHVGAHVPERVAGMWRNLPIKAVANGEPTYENTTVMGRGANWWQGHEAWVNFLAGGTMGLFYGAASLWQWRLRSDEPGHAEYFLAPGCGWEEALEFEGANFVGLARKILKDLPLLDAAPNWEHVISPRGLLAPSGIYIAYQENGGPLAIMDDAIGRAYKIIDPTTGALLEQGWRKGGHEQLQPQATNVSRPLLYILSFARD
jgi:hypothetical protein